MVSALETTVALKGDASPGTAVSSALLKDIMKRKSGKAMRIDDDSYYIKYHNEHDEEWAYLTHYIDVWDSGYTIDDYTIDPNYIEFEDASHHGIDPDDVNAGKRILKRNFDRWVERINNCKKEIEQLVKKKSTPNVGEWSIGCCYYYPTREIIIAEYLEEFDEDITEELGTEPDFCLFQITDVQPGRSPKGRRILVNKYTMSYDTEIEDIKEDYMKKMEKSRCISQEIFDSAAYLITSVSSKILEEIKREYYG